MWRGWARKWGVRAGRIWLDVRGSVVGVTTRRIQEVTAQLPLSCAPSVMAVPGAAASVKRR